MPHIANIWHIAGGCGDFDWMQPTMSASEKAIGG